MGRTPIRKLASSDDIANTILFLCQPESDHITEETIRVNGGIVMI